MKTENFQQLKASLSNRQNNESTKSFYVYTTGHGFNGGTTDIVRVAPKGEKAA